MGKYKCTQIQVIYWPVISSMISSLPLLELVNTSHCTELIILDSANVYHTALARRHDSMEYIGNTGVEKYAIEKYANGKVCYGINNIGILVYCREDSWKSMRMEKYAMGSMLSERKFLTADIL